MVGPPDAEVGLFPEAYWLVEKWSASRGLDPRVELIRVLRSLLSRGLVRVGDVRRDEGFTSWELDENETIGRILRERDSLDRKPLPGDVFWLANTDAGNALADSILNHPDPDKRWISDPRQ